MEILISGGGSLTKKNIKIYWDYHHVNKKKCGCQCTFYSISPYPCKQKDNPYHI